ncbi:exodeoxyribonuclease VII small subunit [Pseudalkalibacillus decolorationis]|uniref:exodeoxyribonuclease VII small subunit n=1 Tax=Pseudalkalibacillus decolorationis TaxID=163879 RepID=UPI0021484BF1|nr:exodeoxyribonuclease VII small subunit [Pseudalkalibacillus decolorationis]
MDKKKVQTFEESMEELEVIVNKLEEGDVPLEESIRLFQEGMKLSKQCNDKLQKVEKQMDELLNEDGGTEPFTLQEDDLG